jgi:hypothetical protein
MPNWCNNHISITHSDPKMIDKIVEGVDNGILNTIIPCPPELLDDDLTTWTKGPEQELREAKKAALKAKFGYESWYDWNIANWGTKWDLCEPQVTRTTPNTVEIGCDTAWSPPIAAFEKISEHGYQVVAHYYESGMQFAGVWSTDDGDECYSEWGDSQGAKDMLPQALDDMFGISEGQAEWEEEERMEEELYAFVKEGGEALEKKDEQSL